jgi:hypothetical protein
MERSEIIVRMLEIKNRWEQREPYLWDDAAQDIINWCLDDLNSLIVTIKESEKNSDTSPCQDLLDHKRLPGEDTCCKCGFKFA